MDRISKTTMVRSEIEAGGGGAGRDSDGLSRYQHDSGSWNYSLAKPCETCAAESNSNRSSVHSKSADGVTESLYYNRSTLRGWFYFVVDIEESFRASSRARLAFI